MAGSSVEHNSVNLFTIYKKGLFIMIYVGIDVAKEKHECLIVSSDENRSFSSFTISNDIFGFSLLERQILSYSENLDEIKIGLEATGHYCNNLEKFLTQKNFHIFIINPLFSSLHRKSISFRKTKTDKFDTRSIVSILMTQNLKPYVPISYHKKELKSLTRYRFRLVKDCSQLKLSFARLINLIFPELESIVPQIQVNSIYQLMNQYPDTTAISNAHLTSLTTLLSKHSRGHYGKEKALAIRNAARQSIGTCERIVTLELKQTLARLFLLMEQIAVVEEHIRTIMSKIDSPLMTVPGVSVMTAAMLLAEIGDFSNFSSPEKILAFAGMEPSIYQSGQYLSSHAKMVKRGSKYLRYALYTAAKNVSHWDTTFHAFFEKKRKEGKHYNVALSHVAKKLLRVLYHLEITHTAYVA
jgi:transposase